MVNSQYAFLPLAVRGQYWLALRHEWRHKGNSNRWNDQSEYDSRILLPIYRPVTGLWGFPITCPIHSFIKACKFYRKKNPKNSFSSCQHGVQSTMQGKRQAKRTRKSSSGKAEMNAGSIAWRKSKPWVAHLQVKAASQCVAWLPQNGFIYQANRMCDRLEFGSRAENIVVMHQIDCSILIQKDIIFCLLLYYLFLLWRKIQLKQLT